MTASILILGAGQDGGSPQLGRRSGIGEPRTASSVAVRSPNGSVVLLDASPDIRLQSQALMTWSGYPSDRSDLVDAVAITHGHMGHYAGLLQFGKEAAATQNLPLVATPSVLGFLTSHEPWRTLVAGGHLRPQPLDNRVPIDTSMTIVGIPVPHRAEFTDTVGLSVVVHDDPYLLYLPDIDSWDAWPQAESVIAAHRIAMLDATFSSTEELPGRDMAQIAHPHVPDTLERFGSLATTTRIVLTHINHTNLLADPNSTIAALAEGSGFTIAKDGMEMQ